jgi:hypothetical protein
VNTEDPVVKQIAVDTALALAISEKAEEVQHAAALALTMECV